MIRKLGPKKCLKLAGENVVQTWPYFSVTLSRYFLDLGNNFAATRDDLENTIKQQRNQIEELEREKDRLNSSLVQSQERILYLQQEVSKWFINTQNSFVDAKKKTPGYGKKYTFLIHIEQAKHKEPFLVSKCIID